jgi:hypothetical protein
MTVWDWVGIGFCVAGTTIAVLLFSEALTMRRQRLRIHQYEQTANSDSIVIPHTICIRETGATLLCVVSRPKTTDHVRHELPGQWVSELEHTHIHLDKTSRRDSNELRACDARYGLNASIQASAIQGTFTVTLTSTPITPAQIVTQIRAAKKLQNPGPTQ